MLATLVESLLSGPDPYVIAMILVGAIGIGAALLPDVFEGTPVTPAMAYVLLGGLVFSLPLGLPDPDPLRFEAATEHFAEFVVIVALMGVGLKIDRLPSLRGWATTWRLLAVTMPLTIAGVAALGWWGLGFGPATALLLGAVLAPTDPVLASDVQVGEPARKASEVGDRAEPRVRFALTSEAGLNDGLAFPFTYAAIAVAGAGLAPEGWLLEWLAVDVAYRIAVGTVAGVGLGYALATIVFRYSPETPVAAAVRGLQSVGVTLLVYGLTEAVEGYGFIAVFVAAVTLRRYELTHQYNRTLHDFAEATERFALAVLLVCFGGAVATGLLSPLEPLHLAFGAAVVLLVRPVAGYLGFVGAGVPFGDRLAISFFGIRGVGSFFYLAYGLNEATFVDASVLWGLVGLVVLVSIVVHGVTAPLVRVLESDSDGGEDGAAADGEREDDATADARD